MPTCASSLPPRRAMLFKPRHPSVYHRSHSSCSNCADIFMARLAILRFTRWVTHNFSVDRYVTQCSNAKRKYSTSSLDVGLLRSDFMRYTCHRGRIDNDATTLQRRMQQTPKHTTAFGADTCNMETHVPLARMTRTGNMNEPRVMDHDSNRHEPQPLT